MDTCQFTVSSGFDRWRFIHNALPEINYSEIDTEVSFLGKPLSFPFLISSMSGGLAEGTHLNSVLAEAAEVSGCALGLGSIRPALEDASRIESFSIAREKAPTAVILANIGISQLIQEISMDHVAEICRSIGADGLIIHLNPLQEAFQPEGDSNFRGGEEVLKKWAAEFSLPLIVKEVGQGISPGLVQRLKSLGIEWVDIAGAGGTNWVLIEKERLTDNKDVMGEVANAFSDWGEPTAEILEAVDEKSPHIIASGGLRSAMDLGKALALGARLGAVAAPFISLGMEKRPDALIHELTIWKETLKMIMFGAGVASMETFIGNRGLMKKRGAK